MRRQFPEASHGSCSSAHSPAVRMSRGSVMRAASCEALPPGQGQAGLPVRPARLLLFSPDAPAPQRPSAGPGNAAWSRSRGEQVSTGAGRQARRGPESCPGGGLPPEGGGACVGPLGLVKGRGALWLSSTFKEGSVGREG